MMSQVSGFFFLASDSNEELNMFRNHQHLADILEPKCILLLFIALNRLK